jgi:hypothetical protein
MRIDPIDRGIAALDRNKPDWRDHVDASTLDMGSPTRCVLGQVFGFYPTGKRELGFVEGLDYGFSISLDPGALPPTFTDWDDLTEAWLARLGTPPRW